MKSHDFGQFIFNNSILDKSQIINLIKTSKHSKPTLAVEALFLQLLQADELSRDDEEFVRTLITPRQAARAFELKDGQSLWFAQSIIDNKIANYSQLESILEKYHDLQIPPVESVLTTYYEQLKTQAIIDFPFAVDIVNNFHSFLSENFQSSVLVMPPVSNDSSQKLGASVKIIGEIPTVIGLLADETVFMQIAKRYDSYVEELEDAYDAISELLNVFTGQFVVNIAVTRGLDEEPEPPRFGNTSDFFNFISLFSDVGYFYLYIGKDEIFS